MASVRQIAGEAGVSITTVSRALNNDPSVHPKTRDQILAIANRRGYAPSIGRRVTTQIGFVYTQEMTLAHPYDSAVLEGVVRGLEEQHFDVVILNLQRDKRAGESYTQFFMRKGVRGVVIRTMAATRDVCQVIADEGFPHVVVSERFDASTKVNCLDCNSLANSQSAVEYLIALGHRRIAFAMHNVPDRDHLDRFEGYQKALNLKGIPFDPGIVYRQPFTLSGGATCIEMIASQADRPTAVYFADPLLGVGAIKKAHAIGMRIPDDLSIVGFDDTDMRFAVHPTMTAVCQDARALGYEAALWLTRSFSGVGDKILRKAVPTYFEINESTGSVSRAPKEGVRSAGVMSTSRHSRQSRASSAS